MGTLSTLLFTVLAKGGLLRVPAQDLLATITTGGAGADPRPSDLDNDGSLHGGVAYEPGGASTFGSSSFRNKKASCDTGTELAPAAPPAPSD